jgi:hypothetical protein
LVGYGRRSSRFGLSNNGGEREKRCFSEQTKKTPYIGGFRNPTVPLIPHDRYYRSGERYYRSHVTVATN